MAAKDAPTSTATIPTVRYLEIILILPILTYVTSNPCRETRCFAINHEGLQDDDSRQTSGRMLPEAVSNLQLRHFLRGAGRGRVVQLIRHFLDGFMCFFRLTEGSPGKKCNVVLLAVIDDEIRFTVTETVTVLDRDDRHNFASTFDMLASHI